MANSTVGELEELAEIAENLEMRLQALVEIVGEDDPRYEAICDIYSQVYGAGAALDAESKRPV